MNGMSIILKKELKRVFGDKKLVFSMFILPAIIMIALYGIMGFMIGKMNSDIEENVNKVYVVNSDDRMKNAITASGFDKTNDITYLNEADFRAKEQDIRDEVLNGDAQLVVYMDKDFNQKFTSYTDSSSPVPQIKLSYNTTENYSQNTYGMFATGVL